MAKCLTFRNHPFVFLQISCHFDSDSPLLTGLSSLLTCYDAVTASTNVSVLRPLSAPLAGMVLAALSFALMTASDTIFKLMAAGHPAYQILFINGGFSIFPIAGWALLTGGLQRLHTEKPFLHLARGTVGVLSTYCAIYAYSRLSLAHFYAIMFSGPLLITALSVFWLEEKIDRRRWLAIAAGFAGILLVTRPASLLLHDKESLMGQCAAFLSVACYALSVVMIRRMRFGESNLAFSFYGFVASAAISATLLVVHGTPVLEPGDFFRLALSGLLSGMASICLMTAYHRSPVITVAPFQYTQIIWGALAGWLLWHQWPSQRLIIGAVIIAMSGIFLIYCEVQFAEPSRRLSKRR